MAQQARERQALTVAPRYTKPPTFGGTETAWRALCEVYASAETPEVVMAVVEYCGARGLDPYKRPVHVVPMYNSRLKRKVQVVMPGINEVEITAARTDRWAGMELPSWGPSIERTFTGSFEDDSGNTVQTSATVRFPEWCAVRVYRMVAGEPRAFTEQLFWEECYGRAGFRSEVPNDRWQKAPRQMLHKCVKAAVLRAAFPEEGFGYTAEEMAGKETDGGIVIDGTATEGASTGQTARDKQADDAYGSSPLDEPNTQQFIRNLTAALKAATTRDHVVDIAGKSGVVRALGADTPTLLRDLVKDMLAKAFARFPPETAEDHTLDKGPGPDDDKLLHDSSMEEADRMIGEVGDMDADTLAALPTNASWRKRVRDLFQLDIDRVDEAIAERSAALKGGK